MFIKALLRRTCKRSQTTELIRGDASFSSLLLPQTFFFYGWLGPACFSRLFFFSCDFSSSFFFKSFTFVSWGLLPVHNAKFPWLTVLYFRGTLPSYLNLLFSTNLESISKLISDNAKDVLALPSAISWILCISSLSALCLGNVEKLWRLKRSRRGLLPLVRTDGCLLKVFLWLKGLMNRKSIGQSSTPSKDFQEIDQEIALWPQLQV